MALAVTLLLFPALAAADNGTDTYNNLFSDLSPLIALFGEQVSKQFLSQSLTVADCILFASAPLGILTGVVSSVRLGGYVWLRAIIGRASESRGAAALELTSATSSGICELWDGKNVIRIQGTAEILSILFLDLQGVQPSADPNDEETDREPLLKEMSKLEEPRQFVVGFEAGKSLGWIASQYEVALQLQRSARKQIRGSWEQGEDTLPSEITPPGVRNPIPPIPPNIALNASSRPSSILVRVAALFGVIIQSAVLVLAGLVTYKFIPQDSDSTYNYALPLLIAGTVLVFSGMTICAWIVIKSSRQEQLLPDEVLADLGSCCQWIPQRPLADAALVQPKLVWLQRRQVVNDETFPAFAMFPYGERITLSLAEENAYSVHPNLVLTGTLCSMIGFIFQFIGLRSLHWSVSVAQLVAMFLTTAIRVFLYMPFSSAMRYEKLPQNFELEWLTNELARSSLQSSETSGDTETYPNSISNLGRAISLRSQLGGIAIDHGWHSSFSVEALRLKDTIDKVLNYLWTDPKIVVRDKDQRAFEWIPYSAAGSEASCVVMKANRNWRPGSWTPWVSSTSDFESIIALWLYNLQTRQVIKDSDDEDQEPHHISRRVLWQICPMNTETCMDFDWWVRRGFNCFQMQGARYTELVGMFEDMPLMTSPLCTRRRSSIHYSESSDNIMAVVTHCSLATVCCRLLFMDFLESALKSIECLDGTTQIRSATDDIVPEIVLFENTAIDGLTSAISILSLFSLQESYALAIPILRYSRLLPNALNALSTSCDEDSRSEVLMHRIVHTYQRLARTAKYQHDWENASNAYSLLLSRADITSLYPTICNGVEEIQKVVQKWMEVELDFRDSQNATSKLLNPSPSTQGALEDIAMDRVLSAIGQMQSAQEIASICFKDLWLLDAVFLTGYARKQGPTWVVELLKEALLHERHAAIVLILLELMDEPAFKRIRSQLVELTQHTMHSYDSQGLELMLFYSTPGPSGLNRAGASLTAAARFNNAAAIRILLKAGVDIDTRDDTGCTPLMVASRYGNLEVVQMNEIRSSTVDAVPALGGMTALELAVIGNHGEIVEMLLGWGAVVNPPYRCDGTPLQLAMVEGSEQMILQLLQAGADINYPAPGGRRTALQSAVENNRFDIVRLLLGHGANVNAPASSKGYTALQIACIKGHTELIVLLLAHAADINAPAAAEEGLTALQAATLYGHRSISIDLIQRGANVNAGASSGGYTAIQAAANNGDTVIFDHLLLVGANIETSLRGQGYTVLQAACRSGHLAMVNHILAIRSIGVNEKPAKLQGMTSVQAAAMSGRIDIVELLVNRGADINADPSEFRGRTALQAAAERGDLVMVTALLKLQANINARPCETEGFTALQAASHAGHRDIVELLRANGADMNAPPCLDKGRTALQAAAEMGHLGVVQYLLSEGAYANERPAWRHGVTAWQIAYANGYDEVAAILAQAGAIRDLEDIDDSYIDSGWVAVYSAELPDWANSPSMERASSPNGLPDTPYYRVRADIDFKEDTELPLHGHSRLQSAAAAGDELLVAELHRARHDLNRHSCLIQSLTPLQTAAKAGHDAVVSQLLAYGADANNPRATIGGHTALEAASKGGHLAVVRRLITAGANVNAENPPEGKSALQLASANGHYPVVEELLDAGAEVNFMSTEVGALTPLQAAVENGWEEIAGLLRAAGARDSVN